MKTTIKMKTTKSNIQTITERAEKKLYLKQLRNIDSKNQHSAAFKIAILGFILSSLNTSSGKRLEKIFFEKLNIKKEPKQRSANANQ